MPDASPAKWHLAHTTWFFETFVLTEAAPGYRPFDPRFGYLFNSYYNSVGAQYPRPRRGVLTRPDLDEVRRYRARVDEQMEALLTAASKEDFESWWSVVEIGLHHEQQHQELLLTDIKHLFSCNPLEPAFHEPHDEPVSEPLPLNWHPYEGGVYWMGHDGSGFAYDCETPRHEVFQHPFEIASRLVTNGEFLAFIEDRGYERPELWLSEGWTVVNERAWKAPLYWRREDGRWRVFTLGGMKDVHPAEPVSHVSFFEADAYARWRGALLPRESAWEIAAADLPVEGNFVESERYHPAAAPADGSAGRPLQMFGDLWEWTASPFLPYPGYEPPAGALGEYNGKFMCNQFVLRGGSCASPRAHLRASYRNFFPPDARWQFTGIRLARMRS